MTPVDWLAFWLILAAAIDVTALLVLYGISRSEARKAYRGGWVDGTMGRHYGHSYPGKLAYPARHSGEPMAFTEDDELETWAPDSWTFEIDEDESAHMPEPDTLVGTVILNRDELATVGVRGETDTAWTKRMARQVREQLGLEEGPAAITTGAGNSNVHGGSTGLP